MNKASRFAVCVVADVMFAAMYYFWQFEGVERAGDVFMFMIWFCGIGGLLVLFLPASADQHKERYPAHVVFSALATLAFLFGVIWAGHIVAAAFYLIGCLIVLAHKERCSELAAAETGATK